MFIFERSRWSFLVRLSMTSSSKVTALRTTGSPDVIRIGCGGIQGPLQNSLNPCRYGAPRQEQLQIWKIDMDGNDKSDSEAGCHCRTGRNPDCRFLCCRPDEISGGCLSG